MAGLSFLSFDFKASMMLRFRPLLDAGACLTSICSILTKFFYVFRGSYLHIDAFYLFLRSLLVLVFAS